MHRFVIVLSLLSIIYADRRRCLLHRGKCLPHCPRDMHAYHTRCDGHTKSQRTCDSPLVYIIGYTCGWSRCDCNGDLLLDEQSGLCVKDANCPLFSTKGPRSKGSKRRKNGKRKNKLSKKVRIMEDDEAEQY